MKLGKSKQKTDHFDVKKLVILDLS